MALKPDRRVVSDDISFFMNETAERGIIVTHLTSGSGAALDDSNAVLQVPTGHGDGVVAGLLMNDVVNLDLTRQHINQHQDEVQLGGKVTIMTRGWALTDQIVSGDTPTAGDPAYHGVNGQLTTTAGSAQVGKFLSEKDAEGYAKVEVQVPM